MISPIPLPQAATLLTWKALNLGGSGTVSSVVTAITDAQDYCMATPNGLYVINLSLEGSSNSALCAAIASIQSTCHIVVVVAAGNSADDIANYSPANCGNILVLGATDSDDNTASWSNVGGNLWAPGVSVTGAWFTSNSATAVLSGTSMASPCAAGVAAIALGEALALWVPGTVNAGAVAMQTVLQEATPSLPLLYSYWNAATMLGTVPPTPPLVAPPGPALTPPAPPPNNDAAGPPPVFDTAAAPPMFIQAWAVLGLLVTLVFV